MHYRINVIIYSCNVIIAHDYRDHPRRLSRRKSHADERSDFFSFEQLVDGGVAMPLAAMIDAPRIAADDRDE